MNKILIIIAAAVFGAAGVVATAVTIYKNSNKEIVSEETDDVVDTDFSINDIKIKGMTVAECTPDKLLASFGLDTNLMNSSVELENGFTLSVYQSHKYLGEMELLGKMINIQSGDSMVSFEYFEGYSSLLSLSNYSDSNSFADYSGIIEVPCVPGDDFGKFVKGEAANNSKAMLTVFGADESESSLFVDLKKGCFMITGYKNPTQILYEYRVDK